MTIPSTSDLKSKAKGYYGQALGPEAEELLTAIFDAVTSSWKEWQDGMTFGGFGVSGAGIGAFSGTGISGKLQASSTYAMKSVSFKKNTPEMKKYIKGLANALGQKFNAFPQTYIIQTATFMGTSGASAVSPGPVNAKNMPLTMSAGKGTNPSGIADLWMAALTPPEFDMTNPQCKSGDLVKAIAKAIELGFALTWLTSTQLTGNSLSTVGAPGGTVTNIPTPMDGKLQ